MTTIPFVDMARLHRPLREEFLAAFARVLESGGYVQGAEVAAFEAEFAETVGTKHALAVSNGTAALHLTLLALGVGPGDEVITVANTFIATAEAISAVGATPVFSDIEAGGFNIDPLDIEHRITPRTKAIIVVHLYGELADMDAVMDIAQRHGLKVIEDACQAHGAQRNGRQAGTFGDAGCFSFYPTKNLGAVGEGGMVVTSDASLAETVARLRDHGQAAKHNHIEPAFNYRMSELQAAGLRVALPHLAEWNEARRGAAQSYLNALSSAGVMTPRWDETAHAYHLFVVRSAARDELKAHLARAGVATAVHYPVPIHLQPAYAALGLKAGSLPRTETAVNEILSLPFHPHITEDEIARVCAAVREFHQPSVMPALAEVAG